MLYSIVASALAFQAPLHPGGMAMRPAVVANFPKLEMSLSNPETSGRRAQLAAAGAALAGFAGTATVASAAEPRSTPWSFSTFLDAVESDLIEKVSFLNCVTAKFPSCWKLFQRNRRRKLHNYSA